MQDVFRREIIAPRDLHTPDRLQEALGVHYLLTVLSEPWSCGGVDNVIDAHMGRRKAPQQPLVCRINDCSDAECGDIAAPQRHFLQLRERTPCGLREEVGDGLDRGCGCKRFLGRQVPYRCVGIVEDLLGKRIYWVSDG